MAVMWLSISIHALAKRATGLSLLLLSTIRNFNPRPRKEGDIRPNDFTKPFGNFNPRPRKEGDKPNLASPATPYHFNPRPRKEGDLTAFSLLSAREYFNPRPRKEGDKFLKITSYLKAISIHALAKRATANLYNDYLYFEAKYHISDIFPL